MSRFSLYDGDIKQEKTSPRAESVKEQKKLFCKVEQIDPLDGINVNARHVNKMGGTVKQKVFFGNSLFKRLTVRYTFLAAVNRFIERHFSSMESAPAEEIEASHVMKTGKEAPLASQPSKDMTLNYPFRTSVTARLVAHFRAPVVFVRNLFLPSGAKLTSGKGACADFNWTMKTAKESVMTKGEGAIAESTDNVVMVGKDVVAESAPSELTGIDYDFNTAIEAKGEAATAIIVKAPIFPAVSHYAKLISWFYPEVIDGELILRQAYSATQDGNRLEVS